MVNLPTTSDEEANSYCSFVHQIVQAITAAPATTLEGLIIKALAVQWCGGADVPDDRVELGGMLCDSADLIGASAIVNDLLRIGGFAVRQQQ